MIHALDLKCIGRLAVVLLVALALKAHYSAASVNDLRWVLLPTTFLVELVTYERFAFESFAGYMNADHTFLIAASCSGVNFFIAAFLVLSLGHMWRQRSADAGWLFIPASLFAAYVATLAANTVRIAPALQQHRSDVNVAWIDPEQLHRLEGIVVYFGFLLLLFVMSESFADARRLRSGDRFFILRRSLIPLSIYWATTLGIPLATGAYRQQTGFIEHVLFVVLTPLTLVLPLALSTAFRRPSSASER